MEVTIQELCKNLPNEFEKYFEYVRSLRFADKPDYVYLVNLFKIIAKNNNIILDNKYDWDEKNTILEIKKIIEEDDSIKDNKLKEE